ncbi:MAG: aldehyde dehydrogenase (NADP(+)) [Acidobacteriota bacterium]
MTLTGESIIGFKRGARHDETFYGFNPATGEPLEPVYWAASADEIEKSVQLAAKAFAEYRCTSGTRRAAFLRQIAANIEALGEPLITRATAETALPAGRIQMEIGRTCNQLRMFAALLDEGSWVDARIDRANPQRTPAPKPDVRSMLRPLGVVVVFGASNFPLAFSTAGGDTASALAAGCTVLVKAHPAHPGTAELVGLAIQDAVKTCNLPEGVFSLLYGAGNQLGEMLVQHPLVKAVGFTGSRQGGLALMRLAQARPEPIPFYAEMSSVNPVFILPGAMRERRDQLINGLHTSVTLGAGQFCTNPGLVFLEDDANASAFAEKLGELMKTSMPFTMLTEGIATVYQQSVTARASHATTLAVNRETTGTSCQTTAALFQTEAQRFLQQAELGEEIFGPTTLLIKHSSRDELLNAARALEGQLTATIHGTEQDLAEFSDLIAILETKAGRLVFNGFPTGVEVCPAMVHGGPFPATSDGRSTSVGTRAIFRFTREVCYQDFPDTALPEELRNENPLGIWRMIDGGLTRDAIA